MIVTQAFNPESCHSSVGFMTNNSAFPGIAWSGAQQNGVYQIETTVPDFKATFVHPGNQVRISMLATKRLGKILITLSRLTYRQVL